MADSLQDEFLVVERILKILRDLPDVEVPACKMEPDCTDGKLWCDARIEVRVAERSLTLMLEIKRAVFPRDVRQILGQFWGHTHQTPERLPFLAAESISPGAKELLREEGVGYCDSGGSLHLSAPGIYVLIDRPAPKSLKRTMRTLFSGRRAQAILVMLNQSNNWFGVAEIARQSGVSRPTVSQVMTELERQGYMGSQGAGPTKERRIESPTELLDAWLAELPSLRRARVWRYFIPGLKSERLAGQVAAALEEREVTYAVTGQVAAQRYAPFLSSFAVVSLRVLQSPAVAEAIAALGGHEVQEGANLEVVATKSGDEFNLREKDEGLWLLSPLQVYLDLMQSKGRSRELADHLRQERIGF